MVSHQAEPINLHGKFLLGFIEHCQQHITPKGFGNQELPAIATQRDMETAATGSKRFALTLALICSNIYSLRAVIPLIAKSRVV